MASKKNIKKKIDELNDVELIKVNLFLNTLKENKSTNLNDFPSFKLNGKLDKYDIRKTSYE